MLSFLLIIEIYYLHENRYVMTYNELLLKRKSNQLHINDIVLDWKRILNAENFTLAITMHLNHESLMLKVIHSIEIRINVLPSSTSKLCDARAVI